MKRGTKSGISEAQKVVIIGGVIIVLLGAVAYLALAPLFSIPFGPGIIGGPEQTSATTHTFTISGNEAEVDMSAFNGRIVLRPSSTNELVITVTKRATGSGIDNIDVSFGEMIDPNGIERFSVTAMRINPALRGLNERVQIEAMIPREVSYKLLDLSNSNGPIEVNEIHGTEIIAKTSNGPIVLNGINFERLDAATSNGRVSGKISSTFAEIRTSNGRISITIGGAGHYDLATSNARVEVVMGSNIPARVEATTSNGGVQWTGIPINILQAGQSILRAETESFGNANVTIDLEIRTSNSGIQITSVPDL